jgi:hypothetical protein
MPNKLQVSCFTDLKRSTELGERGNQQFENLITDHERVLVGLVNRIGGSHTKAMSDGHFISFDYIEHVLKFTAQLQQYYQSQPGLSRIELPVKIGLSLGVVTPREGDVLGSGANKASRIQGEAAAGQVLVDQDFLDAVEKALGAGFVNYFSDVGERTLRDIQPEQQKLFSFDWRGYAADNPTEALAGAVHKHLEDSKVEISNLNASHLAKPGIIIWPVVPRDFPTAIHRGQSEIVRLLALLGWQINVLIADCGATNVERPYSLRFLRALKEYLGKRSVTVAEAFFLADFFDPTFTDYARMQSLFRDIASSLTLQDLLDINHKEYTPVVRTEIAASATLDCLRPALSLAAVSHLVEERTDLSIIISGADEYVLWNRAYEIPTTQDKIGVLMNPKLTEDGTHTARQSQSWPSWRSRDDLVRAMDRPNLPWWTFSLHACLPAFPAASIRLGEVEIKPTDWTNELQVPEMVDKRALADYVWPLLNPSA